jgi:predicted nucleic acid-binding protein
VKQIILDTNVVSEPKRALPAVRVQLWFEAQRGENLYLTSTVVSELAQGIERLPTGRKRNELERWLETLIADAFAGRILVFDVEAALIYGKLVANALGQGRTPKVADAQIAAVAWREGMVVATRDVADFKALQVPVVNPWQHGP